MHCVSSQVLILVLKTMVGVHKHAQTILLATAAIAMPDTNWISMERTVVVGGKTYMCYSCTLSMDKYNTRLSYFLNCV